MTKAWIWHQAEPAEGFGGGLGHVGGEYYVLPGEDTHRPVGFLHDYETSVIEVVKR